jgi:hypothetical protein
MLLQQRPIPGYWYANIVGQLVQVRAVLYTGDRISRIVLEYINGRRDFVDMDGWLYLDLALHSPGMERRDRARDL